MLREMVSSEVARLGMGVQEHRINTVGVRKAHWAGSLEWEKRPFAFRGFRLSFERNVERVVTDFVTATKIGMALLSPRSATSNEPRYQALPRPLNYKISTTLQNLTS